MLSKLTMPRRIMQFALLINCLLFAQLATAQDYKSLNRTIDSLANLNLPKSALTVTNRLDKMARAQKNMPQHIKAILYRMRFQSLMEENAVVPIVNGLKQDIQQASYPEKPVLQSLLGSVYWSYYQQNRYNIYRRTHIEKPGPDFTLWDTKTLINEMDGLFSSSLQDAAKEQSTSISVLDGVLTGDSTNRNLRPTLYDFLLHRALDFYLMDEAGITQPKVHFVLFDPRLLGDSRAFAVLEMKTADTASILYKGIKYMQQATRFHLQRKDKEALADLDLKRLAYIFQHAPIPGKDQLYLDALAEIAATLADKPISADAQVLLGTYYFTKNDYVKALPYFNKAISSPNKTASQNAKGYIQAINKKDLSATVEDVYAPDKPLLALMNYRNVKSVKMQLYKITAVQYNTLAAYKSTTLNYYNNGSLTISDQVLNDLSKLKTYRDETIELPGSQDYKQHGTEFKINALPIGIYVLIINDSSTNDLQSKQLVSFKVSHLAFVTRRLPDGNIAIRVTDRETGKPTPGVHVIMAEKDENKQTDKNGGCILGSLEEGFRTYSIKLTTHNDTLYVGQRFSNAAVINPTETNTQRTILFTDREIYRPGQTVFFKGLQMRMINNKNTIIPNQNVTVTIKDNNRKEITTIHAVTNEFGTFAGSFNIPQNILNGSVIISTANNSSKYIRVEEYKRPNFQVEFDPVTDNYKPDDTVTVKGNVTAYSGYGISNARVIYHITGQSLLLDYRMFAKYGAQMYGSLNIANDTVVTDSKGQFIIKFKALSRLGINQNDVKYNFNINADVTDGSGETHSAFSTVIVSKNNLMVTAFMPYRIFAGDSLKATVALANLNHSAQNGDVKLAIYSLKQPDVLCKSRTWGNAPDQHLMDSTEFKKNFPDIAYKNENISSYWPVKSKITQLTAATTKDQTATINLDVLNKQPSGTYKIIISGKTPAGDTAAIVRYLQWINEPAMPQSISDWVVPLTHHQSPVQPPQFLVGTGAKGYVLMEKYNGSALVSSRWIDVPDGKQRLVKIPVNANEQDVSVQFMTIIHNRMYVSYQRSELKPDDKLDIKFITFRNKLQPGEKEQWKLQITGKNKEARAAEMLAGLYDASLDAIAGRNSWNNYMLRYTYRPYYFNWDNYGFVIPHRSGPSYFSNPEFYAVTRQYERLNMFGYNYFGGYNAGFRNAYAAMYKADTVAYKAMAYDAVRIDEPVGNAGIMIRGGQSDQVFSAVEYKSELKEVVVPRPGEKFSKEGVLKSGTNIQQVDDYGDQAFAMQPIIPRKNFNETAFFYPQLHTDEKGQILIDFTIPEALTQWHFKAFAHTKDLQVGYAENEVFTQKQLSVTANMPRFLRIGDTITVAARLANLTAAGIKGKVQLQLFNALNMQLVNLLVDRTQAQQSFDLPATSNRSISFRIAIPAGLEALTYRLTADGGQFTDGEENTLPVIPNQMLVTESMPMMVRPGQSKTFTFDKLVNQHSTTLKSKTLTLEYTQNPVWYAVQALPYMMEFPYECSEQLFSRYYANSLATNLVNHLPAIKQVFDQWKSSNNQALLSNLEKNQELKATLIEETPWLRDAQNESEQKQRIALLFDLNKMSYELQLNLDKLQKRQLPDGSFPWFGGDRSDRYITTHILAGIGQLYHLNIADNKNRILKMLTEKAVNYVSNELVDDSRSLAKLKPNETRTLNSMDIYSFYTLSYFKNLPQNEGMKALLAKYLEQATAEWKFRSIYEQGMIALTMLRNQKPDVAQMIIRALNETAQHTDELGMYWAKNQPGYYWYQNPVEAQSLIIELFTEAGNNQKAIDEMKIWLLRNKQTNNWKTTTATAAACYALLLKGDNWIANTGTTAIKLGGESLTAIKPDIKADAGTGYLKTSWTDGQIKPSLGKAEVKNNGKTISWGALYWQYLENLDKITPSQTDIHLERKYFIQNQTDNGTALVAVDAQHQPKPGDLLKVVVYLKAGRDFEYVQLKDMRPAGTEPVDVLSTYKYQEGMYYYQVTKDVATNFFISNLSKGNHVFEYSLRVAQSGNFSTGISTVQCMYAPEFNAHSEGQRMQIRP